MGKTLYIFIDESGNFDFNPATGTKFFVLTSVSTVAPSMGRETFVDLKYRLLTERNSSVGDFFHATEDIQKVRDSVFGIISKMNDIAVDSVFVEKATVDPNRYKKVEEEFYRDVSTKLLDHVFNNHGAAYGIERVVVVLGSVFTKKKQEAVLKGLKKYLKKNFGKPFFVYFHRVCCDLNCQIADYCGWAIYVSKERGESRPLDLIKEKVNKIFDGTL